MSGTLRAIQEGVDDGNPVYSSMTPSEARTLHVVHRTFDYAAYTMFSGLALGFMSVVKRRGAAANVVNNFILSVSAVPAGVVPALACAKAAQMYIESQPHADEIFWYMRNAMMDIRLNEDRSVETQFTFLLVLSCLFSSIRSPHQLVVPPAVPPAWGDLLNGWKKERRDLFLGKNTSTLSVSSLASEAASKQDWSKSK
ncbi:MAG: hypothetical protein DHS80DRAFT_29480 [Piptocephalis tieghemiana]|nr:MAG: hypothetical protein DHS80DRAFT_29480 [Piptocephalis tieghemiana]